MWALIVAGHIVQTFPQFNGEARCHIAQGGPQGGDCVYIDQQQPQQANPGLAVPVCFPIGGGMVYCTDGK